MATQEPSDRMQDLSEFITPGDQAATKRTDVLEEFRSMLQKDRLIKVYVAENATPYLLPGAILASISEYFVKALAHESHLGGEDGALRFPEDDQTAWEMLLYWKIKGELHYDRTTESDSTARHEVIDQSVRCWILGDKYDIKEFQDIVILELIELVRDSSVPLLTIKLAFENTPPKNALRTFMAEEAVWRIMRRRDYAHEDLGVMDGVIGWSTELMQALDRHKEDKSSISYKGRTIKRIGWARYLVGDGPRKHWIYK